MTTERRTSRRGPSAKRLIDALRDTGYSFETAIADLVGSSHTGARMAHPATR